jgi:hypothetical protein
VEQDIQDLLVGCVAAGEFPRVETAMETPIRESKLYLRAAARCRRTADTETATRAAPPTPAPALTHPHQSARLSAGLDESGQCSGTNKAPDVDQRLLRAAGYRLNFLQIRFPIILAPLLRAAVSDPPPRSPHIPRRPAHHRQPTPQPLKGLEEPPRRAEHHFASLHRRGKSDTAWIIEKSNE